MYWLCRWPSSVLWDILFKTINSCTDFYSLSINFAGRSHLHVPWPVVVPFTILSLDIGTLCVIVFTSVTIVSIADDDPRVVHASVVLHTAPLLSWFLFWRACSSHPSCSRQKVPFYFKVSRILFFLAPHDMSHSASHVRQHCPWWKQSTEHNTESVYPSWVILYMIINITMLQIMHIKLLFYINPELNYYFGVHGICKLLFCKIELTNYYFQV